MIMIIKFIFNISNFSVILFFLSNLLTPGILFSTAVNAVFVIKLLISGILFFNSVSFAFFTKSVTLVIFFSNSVLSVVFSFQNKIISINVTDFSN